MRPDPKGQMFKSKINIDYEKELNPQQLEVVRAGSGPILVIAGAGSGKTRAVTYRVAYLIDSGVEPSKILLVTFTNKAAREMLGRVEQLFYGTGHMNGSVWGGTFHHIGNRILRRHALLAGYQPNYTILDREDVKALMDDCLEDLNIDTKAGHFPKSEVLQNLASLSLNTQRAMEDIVFERYPFFYEEVEKIRAAVAHFQKRKRELNAMDFDDLLFLWKRLLEEHPDVRRRYGEQFQNILVDEYQDTNRIQADIIDLLSEGHGNIMAVGDDSQSIYSFRGAHFANIISFPERYPGAKVFKLETNYRSTPEILHLANTSIGNNRCQFPKVLQTVRSEGPVPALIASRDLLEQASFVARQVADARSRGVPLSQIAVLYRAHYHSMELQMELTRRGIPFEVRSGLRFFEQAHIKDVAAYLKVVCNAREEMAWKRILQLYPKIGKATAEKIWKLVSAGNSDPLAAVDAGEIRKKIPPPFREKWPDFSRILCRLRDLGKTSGPAEMIEAVLQEGYEEYLYSKYPNYASRVEDLRQLVLFAQKYESCQDFLSELALLTSIEAEEAEPERNEDGAMKLTTVHQAKGLEWSVVFIIWLAEGKFPSIRSLAESASEGEEEERRLFYVAVTRARDELYLSYPRYAPDRGGGNTVQQPSRFITELCGEGYERPGLQRDYYSD